MKVAVIILNWNGRDLLARYLPSVVKCSAEAEVVVADNGSDDDSLEWLTNHFPSVRQLAFDQNYGFAEGYNKAIQAIECDCAVLLNSDVEVTEGWLVPLITYVKEHPEVAACQPKIRSVRQRDQFEYAGAAGGFIDALGYPFCRGRIQGVVETDRAQYDNVLPIFWATGAALFIRRDDYLRAGGLDADFFAHMEEIDLCWRLHHLNRGIVCVPQSVVYHLGGGTLEAEHPRKTFLNFRNNLLMLYKNLPESRLQSVMFQRAWLDFVAVFFFLLKAQFSSAKAVIRARRDYRRMRPSFAAKRQAIQSTRIATTYPEIYPGISLLDFYLKGKRYFSSLRF